MLCFPEDHASSGVKDELRQGERRGGTLSWETRVVQERDCVDETTAVMVLTETRDIFEYASPTSCQNSTQLGKQAGNEERKVFSQIIIIYASFPIYWY